jgi:hypothetical protein
MVHVDADSGTTYLNAATVPRVTKADASTPGASLRHFLVFELRGGAVETASDVWVRVSPATRAADAAGDGASEVAQDASAGAGEQAVEQALTAEVAAECEVLRTVRGENNGGVVKMVWNAHSQVWDPVVVVASKSGAKENGRGLQPVEAAVSAVPADK